MNENKTQNTLIWIILAINALTLILIITLTIVGWNAITQKTDQLDGVTKEELPAQQQAQKTQKAPTGTEQQSPENKTTHGQCGDSVCDTVEKANSGICPQDCK